MLGHSTRESTFNLTPAFFMVSGESKSSISCVKASVFIVTFWSAKVLGNSADAIDVKISPPPDLNT